MLAKLSVDQALMKAKSHAKKGEVLEAQKLYQKVLKAFSQNKRAQRGLAALKKPNQHNTLRSPPQEVVNQLVNLYNQGQISTVVQQAQSITNQYQDAFIVWNILGVALKSQGKLEEAIEAYNKSISLNRNYADAFSNMGNALKAQGKLEQAIIAYNKAICLNPDYADAYSNMGVVLKEQGKLVEAMEAYKKALLLKPDYANAYNNMGFALKEQGKLDEAIEAYKEALLLKPDYAEAYSNMGFALKEQGKLDEAIEAYNKSISINPDYAEVYSNLGNILHDQGKLDQAIATYNKAIFLNLDYPDAYNNMGVVLKEQGKLDQAIIAYNKALSLNPDYADAYNNMGLTLHGQDKLDEAIEAYNKAIFLKPNYADSYYNMGVALKDQDKLGKAIEAYKKVCSLKPNYIDAFINMGSALKDQGKSDEAVEAFKKALSLKPNYAEVYSNIGSTLKDQGKLDEAIEYFNKSISLKPDFAEAHKNLSLTLLNSGRLKEGLDEYEWRWKTKTFLSQQRHFLQPLWDGQKSLNGKTILLWCEQGIGDTINWSSYLPLITCQAKHCIVECQEKLIPLLERSFPNVEFKPENRSLDTERDDFDFHLPMGSIYKHFIEDISQNTKVESFLVPDPVRINHWKECLNSLGKGPYIGISWKSSNMSSNRLQNHASISNWYPILKVPYVTFINLQYKDFAGDLAKIQDELGVKVHNFDDLDHYNNIDDMAALCAALDIVVSTKTTVPLISAGVGTSTKLVNWRQSPWSNVLLNPLTSSVEIFERNTWEPWDNIFRSIARDIFKGI